MNTPEESASAEPLEYAFGIAPDDEPAPPSLFEEINARRAQVENSELLRGLRGL